MPDEKFHILFSKEVHETKQSKILIQTCNVYHYVTSSYTPKEIYFLEESIQMRMTLNKSRYVATA